MFQGLSNVDFTRSLGALSGTLSQDDAAKAMYELAYSNASSFGVKAGVYTAYQSGFFGTVIGSIYSAGYVLVDSANAPGAVGSSTLGPIVRASVSSYPGMTDENMRLLLSGLDKLSGVGYSFVKAGGGSGNSDSSSSAPTKSWWDAITAPIGITSTPAQQSGGSNPIRQTQSNVVQSKRQTVDAAAIQRQYAQNHPGVNVWTARMPWIIGGIGLVLVISIALLVGTNEN